MVNASPDTPITDSYTQFARFLVNYFNNPSIDDVFVCMKIEHTQIGGDFDPDEGEWLLYSTMKEGGETDATADAYVFDDRTKKMVVAAFGFRYSKMALALLVRVLEIANRCANIKAPARNEKKTSAKAGSAVYHVPDSNQGSLMTPKREKKPTAKRQ
ncbi:Uu.00g110020.m01.CDS01 [Anthostomella pinea]|uniref:Uu.00g110020.m01.CDS01 n=1 Tax=Anthostomella pinea TaxID=933095 RepID=A0AAI8VFV4_9PEZI|nr:Uu.00g110020.m01.CDS01 [Anthostomella pinea]